MGDPGEGREASLPRFTNNIAFVFVVVVIVIVVVVAQVYK